MRTLVALALIGLILIPAGCGSSGGGGGGGGGITVTGVATSRSGSPRSYMPVVINGTRLELTDFLGTFTAAGVSVPYSVAILDPVSPYATVYVGLTRPDPTLSMLWEDSLNTGGFNGQVSGGVGYPLPAGYQTIARVVGARNVGISGSVSPTTGALTSSGLTASWSGASTASSLLLILQYSLDAFSDPLNYTGYAIGASLLEHGQVVPYSPTALLPVQTEQINGSISLPPGLSFVGLQTNVVFSPSLIATAYDLNNDPGGTFSVRAPALPNTEYELVLRATDGLGQDVNARVQLPQLAGPVSLAPPAPHTMVAPADNATGVDHTTVFSCTPSPLGVYHFIFWEGNSPSRYAVITADTETTIPDLSAFGLRLGSNESYAWRADAHGPFTSVDEAADAPGFYPTGVVGYRAQPALRHVTTAP